MKSKEWIYIILLMIVIAFVVAYFTGAITGNTIRTNDVSRGKYAVYTKSETEQLFQTSIDMVTIKEKEKKAIYLAGKSYSLSLAYISADQVKISLLDTTTGEQQNTVSLAQGSSAELLGVKITVYEIAYQAYVGGAKSATLSLSKNLESGNGALELLGTCEGVNWEHDAKLLSGGYNCNNICRDSIPGAICATGVIVWNDKNVPKVDFKSCDTVTSPVSVDLSCLCCLV